MVRRDYDELKNKNKKLEKRGRHNNMQGKMVAATDMMM